MAFTVEDFHDLVDLLEQHPAWQGELRRLLLSDEILMLPQLVQRLIEAQQRTEAGLTELAEAQQRTEAEISAYRSSTEERLTRLEHVVEALAEAQQRTEARLTELAEAQRRTEETVKGLVVRVGDLHGTVLEIRYQERAFAYFQSIIRRGHALSADERMTLIEDAVDARLISTAEAADLALADVVVRGRFRDDGREVYLVVEVSAGVGATRGERRTERASWRSSAWTPSPSSPESAWWQAPSKSQRRNGSGR